MTLPVPPQTPSLVIDHAALMHNLHVMQAACDAKHVRLRPHGKMHKCSALAKLQIEGGAVGLCCQTVGEAEAFARAGITDLLVSAPLPAWGPQRIAALVKETGATISAVCDSDGQIDRLAAAARSVGIELGALVDVNIGMHRAGCAPEEAHDLATRIVATDGLRYDGIQAYFGHLQHLAEGRAVANSAATDVLRELIVELTTEGLAPPQVTGGGTGTYELDLEAGVFTELQCGSYALMDAEYSDCGAAHGDWPFQNALFIAATVVSAKHMSHVTIDVGLKATSIDVAPIVHAGAPPGSIWRSMGDEHGAIAGPSDLPHEGDTVWLIPGHCDPTINLYDAFYVTRADGGLDRWAIDARRVSM